MRALVQRVHSAAVTADGTPCGQIGPGLLVYVGIGHDADAARAEALAAKVAKLRIFEDEQGRLNRSVLQCGRAVLAIPNFTLLADAAKGNRPTFAAAAPGEVAEPVYEAFCEALAAAGCEVARGVFGASMAIVSEAAGPVNVIVDL